MEIRVAALHISPERENLSYIYYHFVCFLTMVLDITEIYSYVNLKFILILNNYGGLFSF